MQVVAEDAPPEGRLHLADVLGLSGHLVGLVELLTMANPRSNALVPMRAGTLPHERAILI